MRQVYGRAILASQVLLIFTAVGSSLVLVTHFFDRLNLWNFYTYLFYSMDIVFCVVSFLGLSFGRRWGVVLTFVEFFIAWAINGKLVYDSWIVLGHIPLYSGEITASILCLVYLGTSVWLVRTTTLRPFDEVKPNPITSLVRPSAQKLVLLLERRLPSIGIVIMCIVVFCFLVDSYVMPRVNFARATRDESLLFIIDSTFFYDGGTKFDSGLTYAIVDGRKNFLKKRLGKPGELKVVYFLDLPFRNEEVFASFAPNGITFSDDRY